MKLCGFEAGLDKPLFVIAGPCVVESRQLAVDTAGALKQMCADVGLPFIYKASCSNMEVIHDTVKRSFDLGKFQVCLC